jgi:VIT1/CCC1 family predicted Fe2+/Mn2+ transporter
LHRNYYCSEHIIFQIISSTFGLLCCLPSFASTSPVDSAKRESGPDLYKKLASMKVRDIEQLTGKKMRLRDKVAFGVWKHKMKKKEAGSSQGKTSLIFGISGLILIVAGLFIPYVILAALAASIIAIVMGSDALRKKS